MQEQKSKSVRACVSVHEQKKASEERKEQRNRGARENEKTILFWLNPEIWPNEKAGEMDFMKQTPVYNI